MKFNAVFHPFCLSEDIIVYSGGTSIIGNGVTGFPVLRKLRVFAPYYVKERNFGLHIVLDSNISDFEMVIYKGIPETLVQKLPKNMDALLQYQEVWQSG